MTLLEKINYVLNHTDYLIRHNYQEIGYVDLEYFTFDTLDEDTFEIKFFTERDFQVIDPIKLDFPSDVFDLSKTLKSIIDNAESKKEKMFIEISEQPIYIYSDLKEFCESDGFYESLNKLKFFKLNILKDYLLNDSNFK